MTDLLEHLGPRALRRMTPRAGIALAGAGSLIAVAGAIGVGGDHLLGVHAVHRIPGLLASALLAVAGIGILTRWRSGPIAVGGAVALAVAPPALVFFATVNNGDTFPPFAFRGLLLVCTVAWLALYLVGPARGRMLFLALGLVAVPLLMMEQVEHVSQTPVAIGRAFSTAFSGEVSVDEQGTTFVDGRPRGPELPDPRNLGIIALAFGAAYAVAGVALARRLLIGAATPPAVLGALLLVIGVLFLARDLHEYGTGFALALLGVAIAYSGAVSARRFTTWFGAASFGLGVVLVVAKAIDGASARATSFVFLVVGVVVVLAAHLATERLGEAAEEDERRSFRPELVSVVEAGRADREDERGGAGEVEPEGSVDVDGDE